MSIRLIVDTNILVSAFVFGGATKRYVDLVFSAKDIAMLMSDDTIDELGDTLFNERFRKYRPVSEPLARKYGSISQADREDFEILFNALLSRWPDDQRSLAEIARQTSAMAKANGLDEEVLKKLLDEE